MAKVFRVTPTYHDWTFIQLHNINQPNVEAKANQTSALEKGL